MKRILLAVLAAALASNLAWAALAPKTSQGVLTSVNGKVEIQDRKSARRTAQNASLVAEGEKVITGVDSKATLRMFDGSELRIQPQTEFRVVKSQNPSGTEKVLKFRLLVGKVFASVKKLTSAKSSFEVEAGGVICGVRGTEYSVQYDPVTGKVNVQVMDGSVWTTANGKTFTFQGGQGGSFTNGHPDTDANGAGNGGQGGGSNGQGGGSTSQGGPNDFNPFYGFDGTSGESDPHASIADCSFGLDDITAGVGNDGRTNQSGQGLVLQFGFPEYYNGGGGGFVGTVAGGVRK